MNSWINPHQSPLFSHSSFCGEESLAHTKKQTASVHVLQQALGRMYEAPVALISRGNFGSKMNAEENPEFFQKAVLGVNRRLKSDSTSPNWDRYKGLSEGDKKILSALWNSFSSQERDQLCPKGEWRWSREEAPSHLLTLAMSKGRLDAAETLLKACFQPLSPQDQKRAVAECLNLKHIEGGYFLIKQGFPLPDNETLSKTDGVGRTIAWFAAREADAPLLDDLINRGVDVDVADQYGWTPLLAACNGGQLSAVKALSRGDVNVEAMDAAGWMPIHRACLHGHAPVARTLILEMGTQADIQDYLGRTPLHRAVERNRVEVVRLLCENCEVNPDLAGYVEGYNAPISSRDLARDRKQMEICEIFERYSA